MIAQLFWYSVGVIPSSFLKVARVIKANRFGNPFDEDMIRELIARDKNHPCVVIWSIANEPASEEEGADAYFKPLVELAKEIDPQKRPVTIVTHLMSTPDTIAGLHDVDPVMFTEDFQVEYLRANHEVFDEFDTFVGEQVWNFADFNTSQGIMRVQGNKKGIFTRDRKPKYAAHELRRRWLAIPEYGYKNS